MKPETKRRIVNGLTYARILLSAVLLTLPYGRTFLALYALCGATDVLDGFAARRMRVASEAGAKLDSIADGCFAVVYAVRIVPVLAISPFLIGWIVFIAAGRIVFMAKKREMTLPHSFPNRLTGILVFMIPLTQRFIGVKCCVIAACAAGTAACVTDLFS